MTAYLPLKPIRFTDLFDGKLEPFGVREHINEHTTASQRCLTDGNNFMWAYQDETGILTGLYRFARSGAPGGILAAIAEAFDTDIVSEYEPQFWGYETEEEWDRFQAKVFEEHEAQYYEEMMKYMRGEESDIKPGEQRAEKAKALIAENPELGLPENKTALLRATDEAPGGDFFLDEQDLAFCEMLTTHKCDPPDQRAARSVLPGSDSSSGPRRRS